jgi:hypothetical protein
MCNLLRVSVITVIRYAQYQKIGKINNLKLFRYKRKLVCKLIWLFIVFLYLKSFKLFIFPIFWYWAYLMTVITETRNKLHIFKIWNSKYFYNMNIDLIFCELEIITTRRKTKNSTLWEQEVLVTVNTN